MSSLRATKRLVPGEGRPDPAILLARLQEEEAREHGARAQFRIYLGAAPGVGKTYAMLNEGQRRRGRGSADAVIGVVETYGRSQTNEVAEGLEVVPRRGPEMDIQAVLRRHPSLVLIDELAHRNAVGSRHEHRWQDVLELLEAGISVISTMNIWHLESVRIACKEISGMTLTESVPDWVLDRADDIELIDMAPEALRARLRHGNIYPPERAASELEGLFRPATLAALRELALRRTAQQVDGQLQRYMRDHDVSGWRVEERVLVCVDHRPVSQAMLNRGRRMSENLGCSLLAVCLQSPSLNPSQRRALERHRQLALELGSEVTDLDGSDPVEGIADLAGSARVTQVLIAQPRRIGWRELIRGSLVRRLLRRLPEMDIHVVAEPPTGQPSPGSRKREDLPLVRR